MAPAEKYAENHPDLWRSAIAWPKPENNKYHRGHALVWGGPVEHAGAAKMAAMAALRAGAGLVSIVCAQANVPVYAASALSLMTAHQEDWDALLQDTRKNTVLIGPGAGTGKVTRNAVLAALAAGKRMVIDADALTEFAGDALALFGAIRTPAILTPHAGEFARLFPELAQAQDRTEQALAAAKQAGCVVVLKGHDTVIASSDGRARVNNNAPPTLATAGTGDVLAGICTGLLAQGMDAFDAASAAVWMHAKAARGFGPGLIAEDLPGLLPETLAKLREFGPK